MTRRKSPAIAVLALLCLAACLKPPPTITTPEGQRAYSANEVLQRVDELQNAAIQAEANKAIPTDTTRIIVQFCVSAAKTLKATPAGWQASVVAGWKSAKSQIPPNLLANQSIAAAVSAVEIVMAAIGG